MTSGRVVLCVVMALVASPAGAGQPYVIDGLGLGGRFAGESDYRCAPSGQFAGFVWCQRKRQEASGRNGFSSINSLLHGRDGTLAYVSREIVPAFFSGIDIQTEIKRLTTRFGERGQVWRLPRREGVPSAVIALWGRVELELIEDTASLARDPRPLLLIDYLGDVRRSAALALPVFRLGGGAGYLWTATHDESGRGTLRFLTMDAAALTVLPPAEEPTARMAAPERTVARPVPPLASREAVVTTQAIGRDPVAERVQVAAPPPAPAAERRESAERRGRAPVDASLLVVTALLAVVAVGIVLTRRPVVDRHGLGPRDLPCRSPVAAAQAGQDAPPSTWKSCASAACFAAVAVMIYLGSQSPAAVRGALGYFGLGEGARIASR